MPRDRPARTSSEVQRRRTVRTGGRKLRCVISVTCVEHAGRSRSPVSAATRTARTRRATCSGSSSSMNGAREVIVDDEVRLPRRQSA
jgi:hypothetical protein